jgi:hypothetical protein
MKGEILKLSSKIIGILTVLLCVCFSVFSQQAIEATTKDGQVVLLKSDGTWEYKKADQNIQNNVDKNIIEVDLDDVVLSPNNYKNKTILAKKVYIGDLESYVEGSNTFYFAEVRTQTKSLILPSLHLNRGITFALNGDYVKPLMEYYRTTRKPKDETYLANITAELIKAEVPKGAYFIAKITCIEIVSAYNKKIFALGQCSA